MKKFLMIALAVVTGVSFATTVFAQGKAAAPAKAAAATDKKGAEATEEVANVKPPLCDFAGLDMRVVSARVVPKIESITGSLTTYSADDKIVLVLLKGQKAADGAETPSLFLQDIQAIYATRKPDKKEFWYDISAAVGWKASQLTDGRSLWLFTQDTKASVIRTSAHDGELEVAFMLPKYVTHFSLRIPATVRDAAGSVVQTIK